MLTPEQWTVVGIAAPGVVAIVRDGIKTRQLLGQALEELKTLGRNQARLERKFDAHATDYSAHGGTR